MPEWFDSRRPLRRWRRRQGHLAGLDLRCVRWFPEAFAKPQRHLHQLHSVSPRTAASPWDVAAASAGRHRLSAHQRRRLWFKRSLLQTGAERTGHLQWLIFSLKCWRHLLHSHLCLASTQQSGKGEAVHQRARCSGREGERWVPVPGDSGRG